MNTHEEKVRALTEKIMALPEKQRDAVSWLIEYRDYAVKMSKAIPLTEEERTRYMKQAVENDDGMMTVLLILERCVNVNGMEF